MTCPFHRALQRLRVFAGLPVPHTVKWIDGKPDFRRIDLDKWQHAITHRLCGVCGEPLGEKCYWIGGPRSLRNKSFTDLPMHQACAVESIRLCPFLNGTRKSHRGELPSPVLIPVDPDRPQRMFLMRGRTANFNLVGNSDTGHVCLHAGNLQVVREF